jgi:hypothetical protein
MATLQTLQFGLLGLGFLGSLCIVYRTANSNCQGNAVRAAFMPYIVFTGRMGLPNVVLFTHPMSMRM